MFKTVYMLGIPIQAIDFSQAKAEIRKLVKNGGVVLTPNSEILVTGATNPSYRAIFEQADLCVPDTTGLVVASLGKIRHRVPGADLAEEVLAICEHEKYSVTVIIWEGGFSKPTEVKKALKRRFSDLEVRVIPAKGTVQELKGLSKQLNSDIVLVGLGYPRQEHWIKAAKEVAEKPRFWMAIGGTADYWTGKKPRAPKVFRRLGVEWLWRLLIQPTRIFRIMKAVIVFPWLVFILKNQPLYQNT